jgi:hypothetical protein
VLILIFAILVLCIAGAVLSAPLFLHQLEPYELASPPGSEHSSAERLLEAMSELEQSKSSGKVTEADYALQRERLEQEYVHVTERHA